MSFVAKNMQLVAKTFFPCLGLLICTYRSNTYKRTGEMKMNNFNAKEILNGDEEYNAAKTLIAELKIKMREYNNSKNEGYFGFNPYEEKILAARKEMESARLDALAGSFDQLREEWNSWVAANNTGKGVSMSAVTAKAKSMGLSSHTEIATIKAHAEKLGVI